jgi:hypothetical protein
MFSDMTHDFRRIYKSPRTTTHPPTCTRARTHVTLPLPGHAPPPPPPFASWQRLPLAYASLAPPPRASLTPPPPQQIQTSFSQHRRRPLKLRHARQKRMSQKKKKWPPKDLCLAACPSFRGRRLWCPFCKPLGLQVLGLHCCGMRQGTSACQMRH